MEYDDVRALTEQTLRTGTMLSRLVGDLLDELPDDAFPGEDEVEVLFEMLVGTILPVAEAAGHEHVRGATALLGAMSDRVLADLRAAMELADEGWMVDQRPKCCTTVTPDVWRPGSGASAIVATAV